MTRGEGAFWGDGGEDAWLSCLSRVYGNLVDANIANGVRNLRVKGGGSGIGGGAADIFQLDPELVRLCASVCHQLLARRETEAEGGGGSNITATQIVPLDTTQTQADILLLKHDSCIFRQSSNPVCGSWKSQASSSWAKQQRA